MMEWLGGKFDPEAFDLGKTNTYLRKLNWPHTTESQLRRVLMARDDYRELRELLGPRWVQRLIIAPDLGHP